jgi:hypothetical protein
MGNLNYFLFSTHTSKQLEYNNIQWKFGTGCFYLATSVIFYTPNSPFWYEMDNILILTSKNESSDFEQENITS